MIIYNKLSSPSNYYSSYTRPTDNIKWIVMHYTGNDGDTAKGNANYFANNSVSASAHYFVDDISIYRSVPDEYTAWSVGGSQYSDCGRTGGGRYHGPTVEPVQQTAHQPDGHDATQGEGKQGDTQFPFVDSGLTFDGGNT